MGLFIAVAKAEKVEETELENVTNLNGGENRRDRIRKCLQT